MTSNDTKKLRHPNSIKNLILFEKGISGNPNGRPKGSKTFTTLLREAGEKVIEITDPVSNGKLKGKALELVIYALYSKAIFEGDVSAIKEIRDTLQGKPLQTNVNVDIDDDETRKSFKQLLEPIYESAKAKANSDSKNK